MSTFYNGTSGSVLIGSTNMNVTSWSGTIEITEQDTSNKISGGWHSAMAGKKKFTFTFDAIYDAEVHGVTPILPQAGTEGTFSFERLSADTNPLEGDCLITSIDYDASFDSPFKITCNGVSVGVVTYPGA